MNSHNNQIYQVFTQLPSGKPDKLNISRIMRKPAFSIVQKQRRRLAAR